MSSIHSIGHGNKPLERFISELRSFGIKYLMDVRSKPVSRWHPHFNRNALEKSLAEEGITYVFAGDTLGGYPKDLSFYTEDGRPDYTAMAASSFFLEGLDRVIAAHEKDIPLAMMCSESKPEDCHRSRLIGRELLKRGISVNHIVEEKRSRSQEEVAASGKLFD
jgi:uncharacterized protein (DUF488 family)